jgi:hypothetical protein
MNLILAPRWIADEWFSNPKIHSILQKEIQVFTWHPRPPFVEGQNHHGRKIHTTKNWVIINHYLILPTIF